MHTFQHIVSWPPSAISILGAENSQNFKFEDKMWSPLDLCNIMLGTSSTILHVEITVINFTSNVFWHFLHPKLIKLNIFRDSNNKPSRLTLWWWNNISNQLMQQTCAQLICSSNSRPTHFIYSSRNSSIALKNSVIPNPSVADTPTV